MHTLSPTCTQPVRNTVVRSFLCKEVATLGDERAGVRQQGDCNAQAIKLLQVGQLAAQRELLEPDPSSAFAIPQTGAVEHRYRAPCCFWPTLATTNSC